MGGKSLDTGVTGSIKGAAKSIGKFVRAIASAVIGLPVALAASVVVGAAFLVVEAANICYSNIRKNIMGEKNLIFDPALSAASDSLKGMFVKIWTDFGLYSYLSAAKKAVQSFNTLASHEGIGNEHNILPSSYSSRDASDPTKAESTAKKITSPFCTSNDESQGQPSQQPQVATSQPPSAPNPTTLAGGGGGASPPPASVKPRGKKRGRKLNDGATLRSASKC